jgi:hypothetical protein
VGLGLNSGVCTCKAGAVLLEPHLQSILSGYFGDWGEGIAWITCPGWPWTGILLVSVSQVARHWAMGAQQTLNILKSHFFVSLIYACWNPLHFEVYFMEIFVFPILPYNSCAVVGRTCNLWRPHFSHFYDFCFWKHVFLSWMHACILCTWEAEAGGL